MRVLSIAARRGAWHSGGFEAFWIAFALALVLVVPACASSGLPPTAESRLLGKPLPDFHRATLAGSNMDTSELRGRTVVVKFFAQYCEPCKRTLPLAERLHREHPEVVFIGVSEDEYATTARSVGETYGLSFPIIHDAGKALLGRFRVSELPVTFVADSRGMVRWVGGPAQSESDLGRALEAVAE
ncbi:MAG TPA: TlpA disulfide reductase family protein [Polyangiaceae bacterium]|nr:TlpA disulfide reductase family protein [Polyangiaceae bacterium]